ncbi:MAG: hypothetical protein HKM23_05135, partial [Nitrosopumilus sp.]|nr:hypothetical protein [Nitrosopumilus sp.]
MLKKIIGLGIIGIAILLIVGITLSYYSIKESPSDSKMIIEADVIMPTKVSRPGCEEIDRCYIPSVIEIEKGKKVTWINEDSAFHSVTSGFYDSPTDLFDSGYLDPFESYTLVFDETGVYDYFCTLHPWMKGQV